MITNGNDLVMPVAPMYNGGNGFGGFGNDSWWIVLFLFALMGNWGGFGGNGFGGGGMMPYFYSQNTDGVVQRGFDTASLSSQLSGIQTSLTNGFANAEVADCNRAMDAMQTAYTNQIASMNQSFANSQALDARLNSMQMAQQECCCENRAGLADVKYTIATEECATRNADTQNTQSVLNAINGGIQSLKDQMYQDKMDAKNDEISQLRQEILYARGQASQVTQNGQIIDGIYNRLQTCPVGTVPVYGEQPIFTCNNNGCGCGIGGFNGNF